MNVSCGNGTRSAKTEKEYKIMYNKKMRKQCDVRTKLRERNTSKTVTHAQHMLINTIAQRQHTHRHTLNAHAFIHKHQMKNGTNQI